LTNAKNWSASSTNSMVLSTTAGVLVSPPPPSARCSWIMLPTWTISVGDRAERVVVVHRLPERRQRAREQFAGHDLEEVVVVVEAVGEVGVGGDPGVRGVTGGVVARRGQGLGECRRPFEVGRLLGRTVFGRVQPVKSEAWTGSVQGAGATAFSKTAASSANSARRGVVGSS